jgi:hypothetical protein
MSTNLRRNGTDLGDEMSVRKISQILPKTKRLNVNLPEAIFSELDRIARESGRTMTDVVRLALGIVAVALSEEAVGHKLAIIDSSGKILKELVLPK